jgi:hypothetical protein
VIADFQLNPDAAAEAIADFLQSLRARAFDVCVGSRIRSPCQTRVRNPEGTYARLPKTLSAGDPGKKGWTCSAFT